VTWPFLIDFNSVPAGIKVMDRPDNTPAIFTRVITEGGLGLRPDEIYTVPDLVRLDARIYAEKNDLEPLGQYQTRYDVADLRNLSRRLIYFGSLFEENRIKVVSEEHLALRRRINAAMAFKNPVLHRIAQKIGCMLGGRDSYGGAHLRVSDGGFQVSAPICRCKDRLIAPAFPHR
jgi:hypothetical protein